jgi:O-antigen/teichoic acid export membrane protein
VGDLPASAAGDRAARQALWLAAGRVRGPLYRNALVLIVNSGVTSGLGFIFWALAARLYAPSDVGLAAAAISAGLFVATVAQLGLPYALLQIVPSGGIERTAVAATVIVVVSAIGVSGGVLFIAGLDVWAPSLRELGPVPILATVLATLTGLSAANSALLWIAVAARDTRPALLGAATHGAVKAVLVVVMAGSAALTPGFAIVLAWLTGTIAAVLVQLRLLQRELTRSLSRRLLTQGAFVKGSLGNFAGDLASLAPTLLFPLIAVALVGPAANAYFYVGWGMASLLSTIPSAVGSSLLAEGAHEPAAFEANFRRALAMMALLMLGPVTILFLGAPTILELFGRSYATNGTDTLRVLAVAAFPLGFNILHQSAARVWHRLTRVLAIGVASGCGALICGTALALDFGSLGIAAGHLLANSVVSVALLTEWCLERRRKGRRHDSAANA